MLTLYQYDELYQWDYNRFLLITPDSEGETPSAIHYEYDGQTLVVNPVADGENLIAEIPSVCLYEPGLLTAYEVIGELATINRYVFTVRAKSRPNDYVYDEEAIYRWTQLESQIEEMAAAEAAAETVRAKNEKERQENEDARVSAENIRISNETTRITNERERLSNEVSRVSAEQERESNWTALSTEITTLETSVESAENQRIQNENVRVSAEQNRSTEFELWRDEHSGIVAEATKQAQNAGQSASEAEGYADDAKDTLADVNTAATNAKNDLNDIINQAKSDLDDIAENAQKSADDAQGSADAALANAGDASDYADNAATSMTKAAESESSAERSASSASTSASAAESEADRAKSWAVGPSSADSNGTDNNNAKYWAEQAAAAAGGGVLSFAGRSGFVLPQAGDYPVHVFELTILASDWNNNLQTITNTNIKSSDSFMYMISPKSDCEIAYGDAFVRANDIDTDSEIVFTCQKTPTVDLTVRVVIFDAVVE